VFVEESQEATRREQQQQKHIIQWQKAGSSRRTAATLGQHPCMQKHRLQAAPGAMTVMAGTMYNVAETAAVHQSVHPVPGVGRLWAASFATADAHELADAQP
jgi:hypothetical protein